ncbi:MAG: thioesterase family protein [Solirubrobacterales bacterium]
MEATSAMPTQANHPDFDQAIAVDGNHGVYSAVVHPAWDGPLSTHGGLLGSIILGAIDRELDHDKSMQIRSLTCQYLRPPAHGPVEISVEVLRRGRRFASSRATLAHDGKPCVTALATHSVRELPLVDQWSPQAPKADPPPDRDAPMRTPQEMLSGGGGWLEMPAGTPEFFSRLLFAPRFGSGPFVGPPVDPDVGTKNGGWLMTRESRPIDVAYLAFLVDVFWPSVLEPLRKPAIAPTLDLTTHFRAVLPPEGLPDQPLLVHNTSIAVEDGLADSDSRVFSANGRLLAQGRQLQMLAPFGES